MSVRAFITLQKRKKNVKVKKRNGSFFKYSSILFVDPPKFCMSIVFNFSWGNCKSQKKLKTTNYAYAYAKFGKDNTEYYDIFWKRLYCTSTGHNSITTLVFTSQGFINPLYYVSGVNNINLLLTISIKHKKKRLQKLVEWFDLLSILSTNSLRSCS